MDSSFQNNEIFFFLYNFIFIPFRMESSRAPCVISWCNLKKGLFQIYKNQWVCTYIVVLVASVVEWDKKKDEKYLYEEKIYKWIIQCYFIEGWKIHWIHQSSHYFILFAISSSRNSIIVSINFFAYNNFLLQKMSTNKR